MKKIFDGIREKPCIGCGVSLVSSSYKNPSDWESRQYCTLACAKATTGRKPTRVRKACGQCAAPFEVKAYRAETAFFCSQKCAGLSRDRGISTENEKARKSAAYRTWRRAVFESDDFTCQECNQRGGVLNADHRKPFSTHPALRFEVSNGRTLCRDCHLKTPTYGRLALRYAEAA